MNKIKLTKELKCNWWLIGGFVFCIWVTFPFLFKALMSWMDFVGVEFSTFAGFGPIGDIYGSLNTLFTSATLAIVVYSTLLQRQANEDARTAMAEQLQQAIDASATQLTQANDALTQQLALTQATHDAQMKESKHAIFSNMFNILLNQKNEAQERLNMRLGESNLTSLFVHLSNIYEQLVSNEWKNFKISKDSHRTIMIDRITKEIREFTGKTGIYDELQSYFYNYCSLITLMQKDEYKEFDTEFYIRILSNLMTQSEQETLLWCCSAADYLKETIEVSKLLDAYFCDEIAYFMFRNFEKSICDHPTILEKWDEYEVIKNPA